MDTHPLRFIRNLGRSREIATVLLNYGFGDLVDRLHLRRYVQWGKRMLSRGKQPEPPRSRAERMRLALESLGATFIKFGQLISTRSDLLPADVIRELSRLQEQVPPFPSEQAVAILERELGQPVAQLFAEFDPVPFAAGSLGQVHAARHQDGTRLAVKIRRPGVVQEVERDLSLMEELAKLLERHIPESQVFDPCGLVQYFSRTIRRELSYQREARAMQEFARMFRRDATLLVPNVWEDLSTDAVLTMQYVEGTRADQSAALRQRGLRGCDLAANGARIFMKQAFELGLFHGDPHPGNIRILADGTICLLDYGMIGILEDDQREHLVDLFLAIVRNDARSAVEMIQRIGEPFRPVDAPLLRADVRDFIDGYYGVELDKLRVDRMLADFLAIISRHGLRIPGDLLVLIRVLISLEGVGRMLDPQFNLAEHLAPFVERVVRDRFNFKRLGERFWTESRTFLRLAHDVPLHLGRSLEKLSKDDLRMKLEHTGLDHLITELDRSSNRLVIGLLVSSLIVASALILRTGSGSIWLTGSLYLLSSLLGVWLIYGIFRSGRL